MPLNFGAPMSAGAGAALGLESILEEQFKKSIEAQKIKEFNARLALDQQRLAQDQSQFDRTQGLAEDKFGQELRAYDEAEPDRIAGRALTQAQTDEYRRRPQAEAEARRFTTSEREAGQKFTAGESALNRGATLTAASLRAAGSGAGQNAGGGLSPYTEMKQQRIIDQARKILGDPESGDPGMISHWTAGLGSLTAILPLAPARALAGALDTLKSNISFGELQNMRDASKTGGALGNVSNIELDLLGATLGALDQGLHPDTLRENVQGVIENIALIQESMMRWQRAQEIYAAGGDPLSVYDEIPIRRAGSGSGGGGRASGAGTATGSESTETPTDPTEARRAKWGY